jgi:glutaredoxin 3
VAHVVESVTLFYNETCTECLRARDKLARMMAQQHINFTAKEVSANVDNRDLLILTSGQVGAPVVLVNKREVVGLDRPRLQRLLGVDVGQDHPAHW